MKKNPKQANSHSLVKIGLFSFYPPPQEQSGIHHPIRSGQAFSRGRETEGRIQTELGAFDFYLCKMETLAQRCECQPVNHPATPYGLLLGQKRRRVQLDEGHKGAWDSAGQTDGHVSPHTRRLITAYKGC